MHSVYRGAMIATRGIFVILLIAFCAGSALRASNPTSALGMNLSGNNAEMPFLNVLKLADGWYTEDSSGTDTREEPLLYSTFVDANHYPTSHDRRPVPCRTVPPTHFYPGSRVSNGGPRFASRRSLYVSGRRGLQLDN
jgi:hypothetical protein